MIGFPACSDCGAVHLSMFRHLLLRCRLLMVEVAKPLYDYDDDDDDDTYDSDDTNTHTQTEARAQSM